MVQNEYPDTHRGEWWAPARLGGTAPTPQEVKLAAEQRRMERGDGAIS